GPTRRSSDLITAITGRDEAEVAERIAAWRERITPVIGEREAEAFQQRLFTGGAAVGTPEQVVERLTKLKEQGLGYTIVNFPESAYDTSGIELFESEIIPALR